jgi:hypothetical protein
MGGYNNMTSYHRAILLLLLIALVVAPVFARPNAYMNPYASQVPWIQQGVEPANERPFCTGAASVYALSLLRYKAEGVQPNGIQEPYTRNILMNTTTHNLTVDSLPSNALSVASVYWKMLAANPTLDNMTKLGDVLYTGANYEKDWWTPKDQSTLDYYPQSSSYLNANRVWKINGYFNATGSTKDQTWENIKNEIAHNGVVLVTIRTYANHKSTPWTNGDFPEPSGGSNTEHIQAAVGYNDTSDKIYVITSWGENMWGITHPKIAGITKSYWDIGGLEAYVPRR